MKVCHFTCAHEATDVRVFQKECVSLAKAGYEVYLVAPNAVSEIKEGVHIVGFFAFTHNPLYRLFYSSKQVYKKALEIDADIYHFHDIELFAYGLKLKKKGKKVIFDSHENWIGYIDMIAWLPSFVKRYLSWTTRRMYKKHLSEFDATITVSPHIVDILKQYSPKVYMVTNYPIVTLEDVASSGKEEYVNRGNKICYAGTVYPEVSNQEYVIRALETIDTVEYVMVGTISDKYKETLSTISGWNKVSFVNKVSVKDLYQIYQTVLAGVVIFDYSPNLGYKRGTLGSNKMFEYMMRGLPIISSDQEIWKEQIVDKYKCGICVKPRNVGEIRDAIMQILNDKELAFQMGQNAKIAVFEEFNWGTQETILLGIYGDLKDNK